MLTMPPHDMTWSVNNELSNKNRFQLQPQRARDAVGPCTRLLERCAELLKQWPQNATLERIVRVGDALLSSKIEVLGKVLAGLEVLLHRAQDWEEHAATIAIQYTRSLF